jgi:hypothetical protein
MSHRNRIKKSRKSAVALMMVAGGLAAAVPAADSALAQKPGTPSTMQGPSLIPFNTMPKGRTAIPCDMMPKGKAAIIGEDGLNRPRDNFLRSKKGGAMMPCDELRGTKKGGLMNPDQLKATKKGGIANPELKGTKKGGALLPCNELKGTKKGGIIGPGF